uniref:Gremlin 2, DAN family BMP antagonist n=1 Tax=Oncorhynchus kisutch TaxID=8019 RepID=A0A8C7K5Q1_ONCKI
MCVCVISSRSHICQSRRYLRRDWCKTQPLRQTVSEEGCRSRTVVNRFCYGQCNSFYIPQPFQSCSFCRPHRITQLTVQLDCPGLQPAFRHRKVQRVKQCRCMSVDVSGNGKLGPSISPLTIWTAMVKTTNCRHKWMHCTTPTEAHTCFSSTQSVILNNWVLGHLEHIKS